MLALLAYAATAAAAGQFMVSVAFTVPGYQIVRTEHTLTVFDDGHTRTTIRGAHELVTVGGPNDGRRRAVEESTSSRTSPNGIPSSSVTIEPERVIRTVEGSTRTESVVVYYDSHLSFATLTTRSDISIPFFTYDPPSAIVEDLDAAIAAAIGEADGAMLASFTADSGIAAAVDTSDRERNATLAGDPVSVATGEFVVDEVDLTLTAGAVGARIGRIHRTGSRAGGSLGGGWFFPLDTRIVLGESPGAAGASERARAILAELTDPEHGLRAELNRAADAAIAERTPPLGEASRAASRARELERALRSVDYTGRLRTHVDRELDRRANRAAGIAVALERLAAQMRDEIDSVDAFVRPAAAARIDAAIEAIRQRVSALDLVARTSEAHARRNARYRSTPADGRAAAGTESVILVGPDGRPRRYEPSVPPDPASQAVYRDGSANRYPAGCEYVSADPSAPRLRLAADGTFTLTTNDGAIHRYGFFGELRRTEDTNGNALSFAYDGEERLIRVTDSRGRETAIDRDASGRVVAVRAPGDVTLGYAYDSIGRLARFTDATGTAVEYSYDGASRRLTAIRTADGAERTVSYALVRDRWRAVEVTDEEGGVERFDFASPGRTVYTNPSGVRTVYDYDAHNRTTRVLDAAGHEESFAYDAQGRLVERRTADGALRRRQFDGAGHLIAVRHADGTAERWVRDAFGRPLAYTDRGGNTRRYAYDRQGNLTRVDHPDGTSDRYELVPPGSAAAGSVRVHVDRRGNRTEYGYDELGFLRSVDDSEGPVVRFENDAYGRPLSVTDGTGATTLFTRRADGVVTSVRGPDGLAVDVEYDERGDAVLVVENGRTTRFAYDRRHLPVLVTDAAGATVRYTYRADGLPLERRLEGPDGSLERSTRYAYDERGLPVAILPEGADAPERREYDALGRLSSVVDAAGARTEYEWNPDDLLVRRTRYLEERPLVERFDYLPGGELVARTDASGATTRVAHDAATRRTVRVDPGGVRTTTVSDAYGMPLAIVDGEDGARRFSYDARGRVVGVWSDDERVAAYEYDAANRLVGFTDGEGARWSYRYDGRGRLVDVVHPDGARRSVGYNADGTTASVTDETGLVTRYEYDEVGRLRARLDPAESGTVRRTAYDRNAAGEIVGVTDPTGRTTRLERDRLGRVVGIVDPAGARTAVRLDPVGRLTALTDPTGRVTWRRYDALGRLVETGRGTTRSESYRYDDAGNVLARTDALGHEHRFEYDDAGRLVGEINRSGARIAYRYDAAGRMIEATDATGRQTRYRYDSSGSLAGVDFPDGSRTRYGHDRTGRLVYAENDVERLEIAYDARGRLASVSGSATGTDVSYSYDAAGRRVARTDRGAGTRTTYHYDERGMLTLLRDSAAGAIAVEYDAAGRRTRIAAAHGLSTETAYDAAGRVAATVTRDAAHEVVTALAHVYDDAGRRRYDVDEESRITGYEYDELGRLVGVEYPFDGPKRRADFERFAAFGVGSPLPADADDLPGSEAAAPGATAFAARLSATPEEAAAIELAFRRIYPLRKGSGVHLQQVWTERFEYDAADNRTAWRTGWGAVEYTYDSKGRLASLGELAYSYDMAGSLTAQHGPDGTTTYRYSPQQRLVEAATPTERVVYGYDALGRRVTRTEQPAATGPAEAPLRKPSVAATVLQTRYRYDGLSLTVASRREASFAALSTATDLRKPVHEPPRRFRDAPLAGVRTGDAPGRAGTYAEVTLEGTTVAVSGPAGTVHLAHDLLGSVRAAAERSSARTNVYRYDAFGADLLGSTTRTQPYGYTGKPRDAVTGYSDYGFRDYAPELARFTTPDPARDGGNWYVYARADPVNLIDRWGLAAVAAQISFTMNLDYSHASDTLAMDFHELHDGELVETVQRSWDASNNRKVRRAGVDEPAWFRNYQYYPGAFPEGEWEVTQVGKSSNPMIGDYLRTDAVIDVQTYLPSEGSEDSRKDPCSRNQDGFLIHGGGYTSNDLFDPTGNNRWEDDTLGCLRLRNADMDELAGYARRALDSGGAATIRVDKE